MIQCKQCGKELPEATGSYKRTCKACKDENHRKRAAAYYRANKEKTKAYLKKWRDDKDARLNSEVRKSKDIQYCNTQRGEDDFGCLECQLAKCIQISNYSGAIETTQGFKDRYELLKEATWQAQETEREVAEVFGEMIKERTFVTGNGRNKYVRFKGATTKKQRRLTHAC